VTTLHRSDRPNVEYNIHQPRRIYLSPPLVATVDSIQDFGITSPWESPKSHCPLVLSMSPISRCSESKPIWFDETSIPALCWISQPVPAVVLPIAICLLFAFAKYKQHQERQRQPRQPGKYQQHDHDHVRPDHQIRLSNAC
jgi:hypothetical protein